MVTQFQMTSCVFLSVTLLFSFIPHTFAQQTSNPDVITPDSKEGKIITKVINFLEKRGQNIQAQNILQYLRDGKFELGTPFDKPAGWAPIPGGSIGLREDVFGGPNTNWDESTPEGRTNLINLAGLLIHEKYHSERQGWTSRLSYILYWLWLGNPMEAEAYNEQIDFIGDRLIEVLNRCRDLVNEEPFPRDRFIDCYRELIFLLDLQKRMVKLWNEGGWGVPDKELEKRLCDELDKLIDRWPDIIKNLNRQQANNFIIEQNTLLVKLQEDMSTHFASAITDVNRDFDQNLSKIIEALRISSDIPPEENFRIELLLSVDNKINHHELLISENPYRFWIEYDAKKDQLNSSGNKSTNFIGHDVSIFTSIDSLKEIVESSEHVRKATELLDEGKITFLQFSLNSDKKIYYSTDDSIEFISSQKTKNPDKQLKLLITTPSERVFLSLEHEKTDGEVKQIISMNEDFLNIPGVYSVAVMDGNMPVSNTVELVIDGKPEPCIIPQLVASSFENNICIPYNLEGGSLQNYNLNETTKSLILEVLMQENGTLSITIPKAILDSNTDDGFRGEFVVKVNNEPTKFDEHSVFTSSRKLTVSIPDYSEKIEIMGTHVVPEFNEIVVMILGGSIAFALIFARKFRIIEFKGLK